MLSKTTLTNRITEIFNKRLEDTQAISTEIAQAYQGYASMAMGPAGDPVVLTGVEYYRLRSSLAAIMSNRLIAPAAASQVAQGVAAFWLLPPVHSSGGGTCVSIITVSGISLLTSANSDTISRAASALSNALHVMTKTVFLVYPNPTPPGLIQ